MSVCLVGSAAAKSAGQAASDQRPSERWFTAKYSLRMYLRLRWRDGRRVEHPKIERFIADFGEFAPRTSVQHPSRIERRFLEYQVLKNRLGA
jgi:hypothetical protein